MKFDSEFLPIDDLCSRWAATAFDWEARQSSPIYRAMMGTTLSAGPSPIADDVLALDGVLSDCKMRNPKPYEMILLCYTRGGSSDQKAATLHCSRTAFYLRWKVTLSYLLGQLHARGVRLAGSAGR